MPQGILLKPDGTYEIKSFDGLKDYQAGVNGMIELLAHKNGCNASIIGYANEEGRLMGLDYNPYSNFLHELGFYPYPYVGSILLFGNGDSDELDIPDVIINKVKELPVLEDLYDSD